MFVFFDSFSASVEDKDLPPAPIILVRTLTFLGSILECRTQRIWGSCEVCCSTASVGLDGPPPTHQLSRERISCFISCAPATVAPLYLIFLKQMNITLLEVLGMFFV